MPAVGSRLSYGEYPPFGERTPAKVITMIGPDRDLFLNGRRAENHGLGIGASAYYRRVVENQKDRIFDMIIEAAEATGGRSKNDRADGGRRRRIIASTGRLIR